MVPDWFSPENAPNDQSSAFCDAVNKFLIHTDELSILADTRMLIRPMDIAGCELTYAFVLYKLLKFKNVVFPSLNPDQQEVQVHHILAHLLFPKEFE